MRISVISILLLTLFACEPFDFEELSLTCHEKSETVEVITNQIAYVIYDQEVDQYFISLETDSIPVKVCPCNLPLGLRDHQKIQVSGKIKLADSLSQKSGYLLEIIKIRQIPQ